MMKPVLRSIVGVVSIAIAIGGCADATASTAPRPPSPSAASIPPTAVASATPPATAPAPTTRATAPAITGRWRAAAPMIRARTGFDVVALADGTVLAVGDDSACIPGGAEPGSERAELYDPVADAWTEVASLNKPRKTPATVALPDGSAMVLGGINSDDFPFSSTKAFSPVARAWSDGALLTIARGVPLAAAMTDGRVLVVSTIRTGGTSGEMYDPRTSTWTPVPKLPPTTEINQLIALSDERVLGVGFDGRDSEPTPVAYLYDPARDTWTRVEAPQQFFYALVALHDGGALAISGVDGGELFGGTGALVDSVSRFDPATGRWTAAAPLPTPRLAAQVVGLRDGRVLVAGGGAGRLDETQGRTLRSTEIYDPDTNTWTSAGDLRVPRKGGHALALADGSVLVLGGDDDYNTEGDTPWCPEPLTTVERFHPGP